MIELAEQYPGISIDGFDNALGQGPPASWLSRNVNVILHDVYEPFPSEFIGTYDVVRIQNWLCIWRDATSARLLENIVSLLSKYFHYPSKIGESANRALFFKSLEVFYNGVNKIQHKMPSFELQTALLLKRTPRQY